ncbi:hypothetical protein OF83DRAFT_1171148 [Amylostereum chailletii]|nr:hypothetical protein OF83DRAFT_1171148 [Amylostereum chailletii]
MFLHILGVTCTTTRHLQHKSPSTLTGLSANVSSAPVGVNPECGTLKVGADGSLGNIANIVACGLSIFFVAALIFLCRRRRAAVGACSAPDRPH